MPIKHASWATAPRIFSASRSSVASASGRAALVKIRLEDQLRRHLVAHRLAVAAAGLLQGKRGRLRRETLVAESNREVKAAFELARKAPRPRRHWVRRSVGMGREPNDK